MLIRALALGTVLTLLPVGAAWAAEAVEPAGVTRSAQQLSDAIPVLPSMTIGFTAGAFGAERTTRDRRGCTVEQRTIIALATTAPSVGKGCRITGGTWSADLGTSTVTDARRLRLAPIISAPAAWASGAYGWSPAQRSAFARDAGLDGAVAIADADPATGPTTDPIGTPDLNDAADAPAATAQSLLAVRWGAPQTLMSTATERRLTAACRTSASPTCALDAVPEGMRARAAAAITLVAARYRLAMTRADKARLEAPLDHFTAEAPLARFSVDPVDTPALPTTDGSDATGRVVDANLFGLLAPPAWNSTPNVPFTTLRLWDSGVNWKDVEPSPGRFAWTALDHAVRTAEAQGKKVLLVLGPVPAWASANPNAPDESWGKGAAGPFASDGLGFFERYVNAVVKRYGDRIWAYETWNEANLQTFWQGSPAQMAVMTQVVHDAIARNGATSLTLTASATTRTEGSIYRFFPAYLRELGKRGWPVDGYAVHAYPDADGTPSDVADFVAQHKAYLAIAGAPTKPIYNTELNYGLAGPGPDKPHRDMTAAQSAGWLSRTFIDAVRFGIAETHWFAWTPKYYGQYGIQLTPSTAENRQAWQTTHDWLVGATFRSCREPEGAVICEFERDGRPFWLAYGDSTELIEAPEGATQWCDLKGACRTLEDAMVVVGVRPIRIV